jgi:hypothetical protein
LGFYTFPSCSHLYKEEDLTKIENLREVLLHLLFSQLNQMREHHVTLAASRICHRANKLSSRAWSQELQSCEEIIIIIGFGTGHSVLMQLDLVLVIYAWAGDFRQELEWILSTSVWCNLALVMSKIRVLYLLLLLESKSFAPPSALPC